jgi:hypothetical protein
MGLVYGEIYRKPQNLMVKTMVSVVDFPLNQSNDRPIKDSCYLWM